MLALLVAHMSLLATGAARAELATPPLPPGEAALQVAATRPPPAPALVAAEPPSKPTAYGGPQAGAGVAFVPGQRPGGYLRLGAEFFFNARRDSFSPVYGIWDDLEGWFGPKGGGFAFPIGLLGGLKTPVFVATAGLGLNVFTVDSIGGKLGGGILSPRANARLGIHKGAFYADVVADIQRRWQWKLDDITLFQAGLTLGFVTELQDQNQR